MWDSIVSLAEEEHRSLLVRPIAFDQTGEERVRSVWADRFHASITVSDDNDRVERLHAGVLILLLEFGVDHAVHNVVHAQIERETAALNVHSHLDRKRLVRTTRRTTA